MGTVLTTPGLPSSPRRAWHRAGHGDTARTLLHPGRSSTGPSPGALAEAEAALAPVLALLCWIPGNLEISAWIGRLCGGSTVSVSPMGLPSLHQHRWQQGHLTDCGHGCHTRSTSCSHGACRATRGLCPPAPRSGDALETAPAEAPGARLAPVPAVGVQLLTTTRGGNLHPLPAALHRHTQPGSSPACGTPGSERLHPAAEGNREMWDKEVTPRAAMASLSPGQRHTEVTSVPSWLGQTSQWVVEDWM